MQIGAYALIVAAASLWGIISIFVKGLAAYGFTTLQIVTIRVVVSSIILAVYIAFTDSSQLKIRMADSKYFVGTGICSLVFFNLCYFTAIQEMSVAVAAILLYTAPAFVLLLSRFLFAERLNWEKIAAVVVTFGGCSLVVGILPNMQVEISLSGLAAGLGAGFGYALYSIFGKFALRHYSALTVTLYTFLTAAMVMLPVSSLWEMQTQLLQWPVLINSIGFSLFSTVFAYLCYTVALTAVEAGRAAIIATLEPIVATLVGTFVFGEIVTNWQMIGIILVITAVAAVQRDAGKASGKSHID